MNIGIDVRSLFTTPRTGVGEFTYEFLSNLFQQDKENTYILFSNAFKKNHELPFLQYSNVSWVSSKIPNKLFHASIFLFGYPYIDKYVARRSGIKSLDVWFSPNLHFTSLSKTVKYILTIHDLSFHHYFTFFSRKGRMWHTAVNMQRQVVRANILFTPSFYTAKDVNSVYGTEAKNIHIVYPGVCSHIQSQEKYSIEHVRQKYNLPETFLLFLGTLESRKNIDGLLEAYSNSSYLKKKISIIFAGSLGYKGYAYKRMIEHTEGARYIGYVDEFDKHALYTCARAFVYPSLYEGFGLPVLEAFSCGTPVITSYRTSLPEVVENAGILVNPLNILELQRAMEDIVHDDAYHKSLQEKTILQAKKFSWNSAIKVFLSQI